MAATFASIRHRYRFSMEHINLYVRALCYLTDCHVFLGPLRYSEYLSHRKPDLYVANEAEEEGKQRGRMAGDIRGVWGLDIDPDVLPAESPGHPSSKRSPTDNTNE